VSLHIDTDKVSLIMLRDGWHKVVEGTFTVGPYKYVTDVPRADGGRRREPLDAGPPGTVGFEFHDPNLGWIAGPIASIVALRHVK